MDYYHNEDSCYSPLIAKLAAFVKETCGHRKPSHSHQHMHKVYRSSKRIYTALYPEDQDQSKPLYLLVAIIAWLHDVSDHKYDDEQRTLAKKVEAFITELLTEAAGLPQIQQEEQLKEVFTTERVMNIIARISFSKEKKNGQKDWLEKMGELGILARNIVSDADKLDAIGENGIDRCREYTIEHYEKEHGGEAPDEGYVRRCIVEHYHEKLKLLASDYIRTEPGKELAKGLDEEMAEVVEELTKQMEVEAQA